jgi:bacterial/archaeal transporter family-2 protein
VDRVVAATLATVLAGGLIALQAPLNSRLGHATGTLAAATVNFTVGTVLLVVLVALFTDGFASLSNVGRLPWYYVIGGGLFGAAYVTVALLTVRTLGASGVTAATLAGQLAASIVIDRAAILGLEQRPISIGRLAGVGLLFAGTYLVVR